jgi:hypothetical protein
MSTMQKVAVMILSDPKQGSEEALGRLMNALAAAYEVQNRGNEVMVLFQGTGTRWLHELVKKDHPAHQLFEEVKQTIAGASLGCAEMFGAAQDVRRTGFDLISGNPVPGTSGIPSIHTLLCQGFTVLTF